MLKPGGVSIEEFARAFETDDNRRTTSGPFE